MMLEAARIYNEPRYRAAAEKGGEFILLAQMPEPQPAWAQQYDRDMHPAWARVFEPPSVSGGESQGMMRMLMLLYRETGNKKYLEPIPRALAYYKRSILPGRGESIGGIPEIARRARAGAILRAEDQQAALHHEGKPHQRGRTRKPRMVWIRVSYSPDPSVITHYGRAHLRGAAFAAIEREFRCPCVTSAPGALKRPDRLRGLSPWSEAQARIATPPGVTATGATCHRGCGRRSHAMDARGAWVEDGVIGKANRLVSVLAAGDLDRDDRRKDVPGQGKRDRRSVRRARASQAAHHQVEHVCRERRPAQCVPSLLDRSSRAVSPRSRCLTSAFSRKDAGVAPTERPSPT